MSLTALTRKGVAELKRLVLIGLSAMALAGCQYHDDVDSMNRKIAATKEACTSIYGVGNAETECEYQQVNRLIHEQEADRQKALERSIGRG